MKWMVTLVNNLNYGNKENKVLLGRVGDGINEGKIEYCVSAFRRWSGEDFNEFTTT